MWGVFRVFMERRNFLKLTAFVISGAVLTACGAQSTQTTNADTRVVNPPESKTGENSLISVTVSISEPHIAGDRQFGRHYDVTVKTPNLHEFLETDQGVWTVVTEEAT